MSNAKQWSEERQEEGEADRIGDSQMEVNYWLVHVHDDLTHIERDAKLIIDGYGVTLWEKINNGICHECGQSTQDEGPWGRGVWLCQGLCVWNQGWSGMVHTNEMCDKRITLPKDVREAGT